MGARNHSCDSIISATVGLLFVLCNYYPLTVYHIQHHDPTKCRQRYFWHHYPSLQQRICILEPITSIVLVEVRFFLISFYSLQSMFLYIRRP